MRLALRLTLLLVGIFVCALLAIALQQEQRLKARYEEMRESQVSALFVAIDEGAKVAWRADGIPGVETYFAQLAGRQDFFGARLVRCDALDKETLLSHFSANETARAIAGERVVTIDHRPSPPVIVAIESLSIGREAHVPYAVVLSRALAGERGFVATSLRSFLVTTGLTAFVGLLVALMLGARFISDPLARIVEKTRLVGQGDLTVRFSEPGASSELAMLGRELDAMVRQIDELRAAAELDAAERIADVERMRHADRLATVGTLAAGLAHELGTPLHVVSGRARRLEAMTGVSDQVRAEAESIHGQCERMRIIVEQLLTFARKPSGSPMSVSLGDVATRVNEWLDPIARKKDARLELTNSDVVRCRAHVGLVEQALTNVTLNAIQAVSEGGVVRVRTRQELRAHDGGEAKRWSVVEVSDDGSGIAPEIRNKIFDPFFTTKPVGNGTGLGLAITHEILHEHGGFIVCESHTATDPDEDGRHGTTMRLFFRAEDKSEGHTEV